jgi:hypothetical protein
VSASLSSMGKGLYFPVVDREAAGYWRVPMGSSQLVGKPEPVHMSV